MILLDATAASWGLYQLIFGGAALVALYSVYTWYEGHRDKDILVKRRGRILLLFSVITMLAAAVVSLMITRRLPF
ncbi:hypothetical protein KJS94_16890 [Flavihumibacter rivuli]|uniref:hypothetical protein n=1 Tax=Flavihumibacter rivuli TaxID=2838156 RepID=UPI001BDED210|nr:hypothetical protein [Flavihumibacter rivuli]ULQ56328.1 hypothetical protein KJS94_16890 [Flavihumibacter rivuli]